MPRIIRAGTVGTRTKRQIKLTEFYILLFGVILTIFLGVGSAITPVPLAIFSIVPIFIILSCLKFRLATLVMLFFTSGLIPEQLTPSFPVAGGVVRVEELFLGFLSLILIFKLGLKVDRFRSNSLCYPIYFFFTLVAISLFIAIGNQNKLKFILTEFKFTLYWIYAFILSITIKDKKGLTTTVDFIVLLSVILAIVVVFQSFTGIRILNHGMLNELVTVDEAIQGINRSTFGGFQAFVVFSFVLTLNRLVKREIYPLIAIPVLIVISLGLLVTFGRGVWAVTFVSIFIASIWLGRKYFVLIWVILGLTGIVLGMLLFIIKPELVNAAYARMTSIGAELERGSSYDWRRIENEWALKSIQKHPIIGLGLGGEYKPQQARFMGEHESRTIHNSYLWIALKFGLFGLIFPVWLCSLLLLKAKRIGNTLAISIGAAFLNPILVGYTQMEWSSISGVLFMATMVGLLIILDQLNCD